MQSGINLEKKLVQRMREFVEAARALAGIDEGTGDVYEVGQKADVVAKDIPEDGVWVIEPDILSPPPAGRFFSEVSALAGAKKHLVVEAIDLDSSRAVISGYGEEMVGDSYYHRSMFAGIIDSSLKIQTVDIRILADEEGMNYGSESFRGLVSTLISGMR